MRWSYTHLAIISNSRHTVGVAEVGTTSEIAARTRATRTPDVAARLRAVGLSATAPRRQVLEALSGHAAPISAGKVYAIMQVADVRIGLTSVYRILHLLADHGCDMRNRASGRIWMTPRRRWLTSLSVMDFMSG